MPNICASPIMGHVCLSPLAFSRSPWTLFDAIFWGYRPASLASRALFSPLVAQRDRNKKRCSSLVRALSLSLSVSRRDTQSELSLSVSRRDTQQESARTKKKAAVKSKKMPKPIGSFLSRARSLSLSVSHSLSNLLSRAVSIPRAHTHIFLNF